MAKKKKTTQKKTPYINFFENIYYWVWLLLTKSEAKKQRSYTKECAGVIVFSCLLGNFIFLFSCFVYFKRDILTYLFSHGQRANTLFLLLLIVAILCLLCYLLLSCRTTSIVRRVGQLPKKERTAKQRVYRVYIFLTVLILMAIPFCFRIL